MNTKEMNLIALYSSQKLIKEMFKNENKTAKQCYQNLANILVGNAKSSMQTMLRKAMGELTLEIMGLTKECFNKDGFVQTPGIKNMMKDIKKVLPKEFSSVDSDRFLKMTRDSIAHNSIEKNNITEEQFNSFNIKLPKNKSGEKALLNVPKLNMIEHMIQYDNARNLGKQFSRLEFEDTYCDTIEDVLKGKKKFGKFSKFINIYDDNGKGVDFDQYQENAFLRFLIKYKKLDSKLKSFDYLKLRFFPFKDNKLSNYELKHRLLFFYGQLFTNINLKMSDFVKIFKSYNDPCGMFCFMDEETLLATVYSSMCFNMFASRDNDEIHQLLKSAGCEIDQEKVRHLRNSFIHGRYFYNYKDGFEIYDGINDMEHYLTFSFEQINKVYEEYSKEKVEFVKQERLKLILNSNSGENQL